VKVTFAKYSQGETDPCFSGKLFLDKNFCWQGVFSGPGYGD